MTTKLDEIGPDIYRLSTFVPEIGPEGFTFNQFLIVDEEPLLFHTGHRSLFPSVREAIERVMPLPRLRWITFGHVESDECGAMNELLAAAPNSQVAHGALGCMVSIGEMADRPPRALAGAEDLFGYSCLAPSTPETVEGLADLEPAVLALMHGSSFSGDCAGALRDLATDYRRRMAPVGSWS